MEINYPGQYNVDLGGLASMVEQKASTYDEGDLRLAYAKNFADSIEILLKDKAIIAYSRENSPRMLIERVFEVFSANFDEQVRIAERKNSERREKHLAEKAEAQQSLYAALTAFGIFLLIVFLSIIIRIERNLRPESRVVAK